MAEQAYGPQGPGLDVDLSGMEELAVKMQQALLQGLCEELTQRQAERLPGTQPCPDCGDECDVRRREEMPPDSSSKGKGHRRMQLRGGSFDLTEPEYYCRRCRRSFFPSAVGTTD